MWWAAAADWSAKAVDQFLGQQAAHKANRTNIMLARENRDWMTQMSNSALQRHMADAKAAGINPLYALGTGASTPTGTAAMVQPTYRAGNPIAVSDALLKAATAKNLDAQSRETNARAAIVESQIPTSGATAEATLDKLKTEVSKMGYEINEIMERTTGHIISYENAVKMAPLLQRGQELINQGLQKGLSRKDLEKNIADSLNMPLSKVGEFVDWLNGIGSSGSQTVHDWVDVVQKKWGELKNWFDNFGRR